MTKTDKIIKANKRIHRNSYCFKPGVFRVIWWGCIGLLAASLIQPFCSDMAASSFAIVFAGVSVSVFVIGMLAFRPDKSDVSAYKRVSDFLFLGLHDLSKENLNDKSSDVISRSDEIGYIENVLENVIFPQGNIKQALCITGKSGCGKSTILSFFQQKHKDDERYKIYNFTGNYNTLRSALEKSFDTADVRSKINELVYHNKKVVFILDQFERYFFLEKENQQHIREFIVSLCQKNTAVIVSLREEFLAEFLREFDLNDINSNSILSEKVVHHGLLRSLVGFIKDNDNFIVLQGSRRTITYSKWNQEHIKNPKSIHILDPISDGVAEFNRPGVTLFYCENQNNNSASIKDNCIRCFDSSGSRLYEKYHDKPLIEQEIIFHMAEYDTKERNDPDAAEKYCKMEEQDILKRYFDIQLSASGDFYNSMRVLYILSTARLHQITMKTKEIATGLFADQFSKNAAAELKQTFRRLEELQLIKRSNESSVNEYEISHDFIAFAFINYCRGTMDRNVKDALDIYISDYLEEYEKASASAMSGKAEADRDADNKFYQTLKKNIDKQNRDKYYKIIAGIIVVLIVITDVIYRFVWNPWHSFDIKDPFNGFFPVFIPIHLLICVVYFYQVFDKVFRFHSINNSAGLKGVYLLLSVIAYLSELIYPHFLFTDGFDLVLIGLTAVMILRGDYREASKNSLQRYGAKCMVMGGIFALAHLMFYLFKNELSSEIIILETVAMAALTAFAHLSHLSVEYLYGRRMDVSGIKKE